MKKLLAVTVVFGLFAGAALTGCDNTKKTEVKKTTEVKETKETPKNP